MSFSALRVETRSSNAVEIASDNDWWAQAIERDENARRRGEDVLRFDLLEVLDLELYLGDYSLVLLAERGLGGLGLRVGSLELLPQARQLRLALPLDLELRSREHCTLCEVSWIAECPSAYALQDAINRSCGSAHLLAVLTGVFLELSLQRLQLRLHLRRTPLSL